MKRILIDGRFIGVGESMTRYCLEIVQGILKLDKENEYTLLIRPAGIKKIQEFFKIENSSLENLMKIAQKGSANAEKLKIENSNLNIEILDIPHYSLAEQTQLLKYLNAEKFDLVHFIQFNHPVRYRGKFVVSIHDLTLIGHLHRQRFYKRLAFGQVMKSAAKNSAKIITISETSKQEIVEYYNVPGEKISVTYLAVDPKYQPGSKISDFDIRISDFRQKYNISGEYLLYTGMWKRHKNILLMLKAFEKFQDTRNNHQTSSNNQIPNIQLVLVGKIDTKEPEVLKLINKVNQLHSEQNEPIITTGFVDEDELPVAYAGAMAYIIPSLSEGFGLPPLEAMACGIPVISSSVSAMPEILGEAALYFDPYDVDDMAAKMQQIVSDGQLRADLSEKGIAQAGKYSWDDTAKKTLEVYKEVLKEK